MWIGDTNGSEETSCLPVFFSIIIIFLINVRKKGSQMKGHAMPCLPYHGSYGPVVCLKQYDGKHSVYCKDITPGSVTPDLYRSFPSVDLMKWRLGDNSITWQNVMSLLWEVPIL